jgi:hypothetical protein
VSADLLDGQAGPPQAAGCQATSKTEPEATRKLSHPAGDPSNNSAGVILVPLVPERAAAWQPIANGFLRCRDGTRPQVPRHRRFDCVGGR